MSVNKRKTRVFSLFVLICIGVLCCAWSLGVGSSVWAASHPAIASVESVAIPTESDESPGKYLQANSGKENFGLLDKTGHGMCKIQEIQSVKNPSIATKIHRNLLVSDFIISSEEDLLKRECDANIPIHRKAGIEVTSTIQQRNTAMRPARKEERPYIFDATIRAAHSLYAGNPSLRNVSFQKTYEFAREKIIEGRDSRSQSDIQRRLSEKDASSKAFVISCVIESAYREPKKTFDTICKENPIKNISTRFLLDGIQQSMGRHTSLNPFLATHSSRIAQAFRSPTIPQRHEMTASLPQQQQLPKQSDAKVGEDSQDLDLMSPKTRRPLTISVRKKDLIYDATIPKKVALDKIYKSLAFQNSVIFDKEDYRALLKEIVTNIDPTHAKDVKFFKNSYLRACIELFKKDPIDFKTEKDYQSLVRQHPDIELAQQDMSASLLVAPLSRLKDFESLATPFAENNKQFHIKPFSYLADMLSVLQEESRTLPEEDTHYIADFKANPELKASNLFVDLRTFLVNKQLRDEKNKEPETWSFTDELTMLINGIIAGKYGKNVDDLTASSCLLHNAHYSYTQRSHVDNTRESEESRIVKSICNQIVDIFVSREAIPPEVFERQCKNFIIYSLGIYFCSHPEEIPVTNTSQLNAVKMEKFVWLIKFELKKCYLICRGLKVGDTRIILPIGWAENVRIEDFLDSLSVEQFNKVYQDRVNPLLYEQSPKGIAASKQPRPLPPTPPARQGTSAPPAPALAPSKPIGTPSTLPRKPIPKEPAGDRPQRTIRDALIEAMTARRRPIQDGVTTIARETTADWT